LRISGLQCSVMSRVRMSLRESSRIAPKTPSKAPRHFHHQPLPRAEVRGDNGASWPSHLSTSARVSFLLTGTMEETSRVEPDG
jgi:hypothetical protein